VAIGTELLQELLASGRCGRILCVEGRLPALISKVVIEYLVDFEHLAGFLAAGRVDDIFCARSTPFARAGPVAGFQRVDFEQVLKFGALFCTVDYGNIALSH
jgi:hypothetical protein